jgi:hypothetical protein
MGNVFQLYKLDQVAELVVLTNVNFSIRHYLEGPLYTLTPKESYIGVVSSVLMSVYAQKSPACERLVHLLDSLCHGCCCILAQ